MRGRVCIFGEVLFDCFADGRQVLGGAPFNVAWHLQAFGESPLVISRIGDDREGATVLAAMKSWGMETSGLQTDSRLPTGRVRVTIDNGEPSYDIVRPAAWDAITAPATLPPLALLYHGSLALRDARSAVALESLHAARPGKTFVDVNLRPPWWSRDEVLAAVHRANWVKLNRHELDQLAPGGGEALARARSFVAAHRLETLVLTDGSRGANLLTAAGDCHQVDPGPGVEVVDTVGAGDAFAAVIIVGLLRGWPLLRTVEQAQRFASRVVGRRGATVLDPEFYESFVADFETEGRRSND